jgi:hypothetical protein
MVTGYWKRSLLQVTFTCRRNGEPSKNKVIHLHALYRRSFLIEKTLKFRLERSYKRQYLDVETGSSMMVRTKAQELIVDQAGGLLTADDFDISTDRVCTSSRPCTKQVHHTSHCI